MNRIRRNKKAVYVLLGIVLLLETGRVYADESRRNVYEEIIPEGYFLSARSEKVTKECYVAEAETICTYGGGCEMKTTFLYMDFMGEELSSKKSETIAFGQYSCSLKVYNPRYAYKDYWSLADKDVFRCVNVKTEHICVIGDQKLQRNTVDQ